MRAGLDLDGDPGETFHDRSGATLRLGGFDVGQTESDAPRAKAELGNPASRHKAVDVSDACLPPICQIRFGQEAGLCCCYGFCVHNGLEPCQIRRDLADRFSCPAPPARLASLWIIDGLSRQPPLAYAELIQADSMPPRFLMNPHHNI